MSRAPWPDWRLGPPANTAPAVIRVGRGTRPRYGFAVALSVLGALLAGGCQEASPPSAKPLVVASFYPLYEFSRHVGGDRATVVSLVPEGVEPHDWEPSPHDVIAVHKASLFVYNGSGFEPWAERMLKDLAGSSTAVLEASRNMPLVRIDGTDDPHVWLDPMLARAQVEAIEGALARVDPRHASAYSDNARAFMARLDALDQAFAKGLADCESRDVVTSHAAFSYLARRYRLNQLPVMGVAPESEPSPAALAAMARLARERRVRYIFFETLLSPRLAETLAREVGAKVLVLNPLEGVTREEAAAGKGYVELMEANLANLRTGLGCK